jgi:thioredoxin reductase
MGMEPGERRPVAVIGAGPAGLVAAAHLVSRGEVPLVLEAGDTVGASVRRWSPVLAALLVACAAAADAVLRAGSAHARSILTPLAEPSA